MFMRIAPLKLEFIRSKSQAEEYQKRERVPEAYPGRKSWGRQSLSGQRPLNFPR